MSWNIIVASSEGDQLDELINGAQEIAMHMKPRAARTVRIATSVEQLRQKRNAETGLLIVSASLPEIASSSDAEHEPGLNFIRTLGSEAAAPACILVSARYEHYRIVQAINRCELLVVDDNTNYVAQCLQLARRLNLVSPEPAAVPATTEPPPPPDPRPPGGGARARPAAESSSLPAPPPISTFALLEVSLPTDPRSATVSLEIHEPGRIEKREPQPLGLRGNRIRQLMDECRKLKDKLSEARPNKHYDRWHADYRKLGEGISNLLWSSASFKEYYDYGSGAAKRNIRVRFNLQQPWFDGFWEAISAASGERRFLMLDNTIARRALDSSQVGVFTSDSGQIDTDDGVLNVLVIKSNVPDGSEPKGPDDRLWESYWASYRGRLPELMHLDREVQVLSDLRRPRAGSEGRRKFRVKIDVLPRNIPLAGAQWSLADTVEAWLKSKSRRYDIVHFAGHALFADSPREDGRGYLVFSGFPQPEAIPIARVATWLANAGVQLVYLSCCRSSAASAALEFARNKIPMAIGFHWDLDDSKAPVFARQFYEELLDANLKVCPAVSKARLELYNEFKEGDPIWASPVLIAQPMNWIQVEGVLKLAPKQDRHRSRPSVGPPPPPAPAGVALQVA